MKKLILPAMLLLAVIAKGQMMFIESPIAGMPDLVYSKIAWADYNNDGYIDFVITGVTFSGQKRTMLFKNTATGSFTLSKSFEGVSNGTVSWGDINNDNYPDMHITGLDASGNKISQIHLNNTDGTFTPLNLNLEGVNFGASAIADLNGDGKQDLIYFGINSDSKSILRIYKNNGDLTFSEMPHTIPGVSEGTVAIADFDRDGRVDILISGINSQNRAVTEIFRNKGQFIFETTNTTISNNAYGDVAVADYDGDGLPDVVISGLNENILPQTKLYRNLGSMVFQEVPFGLPPMKNSAVSWADFNGDGKMDILINGSEGSDARSQLYQNHGSNNFTLSISGIMNVSNGNHAWADVDNDGDLDLLISGNNNSGVYSQLYINQTNHTVVAPPVPTSLMSVAKHDSAVLSWTAPSNGSTYNIYIGTGPGKQDVVSPLSDLATGKRKVHHPTNGGSLNQYVIKDLPEGDYYWSVQSVVNGFWASPFAAEQHFKVCHAVDLGGNRVICQNDRIALTAGTVNDQVQWYSKNGISLTGNHFDVAFQSTDTVWVEVRKSNGCTVKDTIEIKVNPLPSAAVHGDLDVCLGEELVLTAGTGTDETVWSSNEMVIGDQHLLRYQITKPETIIVKVTDLKGCSNSASMEIDPFPIPIVELGQDRQICFLDNLLLNAGVPDDDVNWYSLKRGWLSAENELKFVVSEHDSIWTEVENIHGCKVSKSIKVLMLPAPQFDLGPDRSICIGETISLEAGTSFNQVEWHTAKLGLIKKDHIKLDFQVAEHDTIWAVLRNSFGCLGYDSIKVTALALPDVVLASELKICENDKLSLAVGDLDDQVSWYFVGEADPFSTDKSIEKIILQDLNIAVVTENILGCIKKDTVSIEKIDLPIPTMPDNMSICERTVIELTEGEESDMVSWHSLTDGALGTGNQISLLIDKEDNILVEIINEYGCTVSNTTSISILERPELTLPPTVEICMGEILHLDAGEVGVKTIWSSISGLTEESDLFSLVISGDENISVQTEYANGCVNHASTSVTALPLPIADLGEDLKVCYSDEVLLDAKNETDIVSWYSFSHGLLNVNSPNFSFTANFTDTVNIKVLGTNGCLNFDTLVIDVLPLPEISLGTDTAICYGQNLILESGKSTGRSDWYVDEMIFLENTHHLALSVVKNAQVTLQYTDGHGCKKEDVIEVEMKPLPEVVLVDTIKTCFGSSVLIEPITLTADSINWYAADIFVKDHHLNVYETTAHRSMVVRAEVFNHHGCRFEDKLYLKVLELPVIDAGEGRVICNDQTVVLGGSPTLVSANEGDVYFTWSPSDRVSDPSAANPIATITSTTEFILQATDAMGCVNYDTILIEVDPFTYIDAGVDTAICFGSSIRLGGNPTASGSTFPYQYQWGPQHLFDNPFNPNPVIKLYETTKVRVLVTTGNCKVDTAEVLITVNPLPVISTIGDVAIGHGETKTLFATGGVKYKWTPEKSIRYENTANPEVSPTETTKYTVEVMDANGCTENETLTVIVNNHLFIPDMFTPNGDGKNDYFQVYGYGMKNFSLKIYDRSGQIVYETYDFQVANEKGWDGTFRAVPQPSGSYTWIIVGVFHNGEPVRFKGKQSGTVLLVR